MPINLSLSFLGSYRVGVNQKVMPISRTKKIEVLLAYLVMEKAQAHLRTTLDHLLFPNLPEKAARTNLRQTITRLRRLVHDDEATPSFFFFTPETAQFNVASNYTLDVQTFLTNVRGCSLHKGSRDDFCEGCALAVAGAVELYSGPFLDGIFVEDSHAFERWVETWRTQLHHEMLNALKWLVNYHEGRGEYQIALTYVQQLLALEPWQEQAYQQGMRLLTYEGRRDEALIIYKKCQAVLQRELQVDPALETELLAQRIQTMAEERPYQLPSVSERPFIGRDKEFGDIRQRLARQEQRLLTLMGPGGIGKTQLALRIGWAIAKENIGPFIDGVFFISLVDDQLTAHRITDNLLVTAISEAVSSTLIASLSPKQQLLRLFRDKNCLLILDNCENLETSGRLFIANIIRQTPSVKVLVTSRERLNIAEEWVVDVDGLPHPFSDFKQQTGLPLLVTDQMGDSDSVKLFCQRASQVDSGFSWKGLSIEEKTAVVRICQLTGGMPLALEMAAAWVRVLSCQEIALEIDNKLTILSSTFVNQPARHQSMRAVFEYSWQMLSLVEQDVLTQLSVFRGQFDWNAAQSLVDFTLLTLTNLCDKSLLQHIQTANGTWYQMHPLLKQFAVEKLGNEQKVLLQANHAAYYGRYLSQRVEQFRGPELADVLQELTQNIEDIRAGWLWTIEQERIDLIGEYCFSLYQFYALRNWNFEGRDMFRKAVDVVQKFNDVPLPQMDPTDAHLLLQLSTRLAEFCTASGNLDEAETLLQVGKEMGHFFEDPVELALVYEKYGMIVYRRGQYEAALESLQYGYKIAEEIDSKQSQAHILMSMGAVARDMTNYAQAASYFEQSLSLYRELASQWGYAHAMRLLAWILYQQGDYEGAVHYLDQSFAEFQQLNDQIGVAHIWYTRGQIACAEAQYDQAQKLFNQGLTLFQTGNFLKGVAISYEGLAKVASKLQQIQKAKGYFLTSFETAVTIQDLPLILELLLGISCLLLQSYPNEDQRTREAIDLLAVAYTHPVASSVIKERAHNLWAKFIPKPITSVTAVSQRTLPEVEQLIHDICRS